MNCLFINTLAVPFGVMKTRNNCTNMSFSCYCNNYRGNYFEVESARPNDNSNRQYYDFEQMIILPDLITSHTTCSNSPVTHGRCSSPQRIAAVSKSTDIRITSTHYRNSKDKNGHHTAHRVQNQSCIDNHEWRKAGTQLREVADSFAKNYIKNSKSKKLISSKALSRCIALSILGVLLFRTFL